MFRRLTLLIIGLAIFATACTSEGLPSDYADQDRRAEKQFVEACKGALDDGEAPEFCQCAFYTVAAELTFAEFLELDDQLKDKPDSLSLEQRQLIESVSLPCKFSEDDINQTVEAS